MVLPVLTASRLYRALRHFVVVRLNLTGFASHVRPTVGESVGDIPHKGNLVPQMSGSVPVCTPATPHSGKSWAYTCEVQVPCDAVHAYSSRREPYPNEGLGAFGTFPTFSGQSLDRAYRLGVLPPNTVMGRARSTALWFAREPHGLGLLGTK